MYAAMCRSLLPFSACTKLRILIVASAIRLTYVALVYPEVWEQDVPVWTQVVQSEGNRDKSFVHINSSKFADGWVGVAQDFGSSASREYPRVVSLTGP